MRIVLLSDRAGSGQGQAKSNVLALDPMRAGPRHQHLTLTLALIGSGWAHPRANGARHCPWTVYSYDIHKITCIVVCL